MGKMQVASVAALVHVADLLDAAAHPPHGQVER
jgi:hypothetical protein